MKSNCTSEKIWQLRILLTSLTLAFGSTFLFSFSTPRIAADLWGQLGLSQQETSTRIKDSFLSGYLQHYGIRGLKNLAAADRAAVTKELAVYVKQYVQSEAFQKEYQQYRESSKPTPPDPARTKDQIQKDQIAEYKRLILETEANAKQAAPEYKKIFQDGLVQLQGELKKWEDPNSPMLKIIAEGEAQNYQAKLNRYKEKMADWEQKKPANPQHLVRLRLQEFLEKTKDVDYTAQLTDGRNGKKIFANPDYERKPADWKKAYRAGKEATETARDFAQAWLKEIK